MKNLDNLRLYLNEAIGVKSGINATGIDTAVNNMTQSHSPTFGQNKTEHAGAFDPEGGGHDPEEIAKKSGIDIEEVNRRIVIGVRTEIAKGVTDKAKARKIVTDKLFNNIEAYSNLSSQENKTPGQKGAPAGAPPSAAGAPKNMNEAILDKFINMARQPILEQKTIYDNFCYMTEAQLKDFGINPNESGRAYTVVFKFHGQTKILSLFWPDTRRPTRQDMQAYVEALYPMAKLMSFTKYEKGDHGLGLLLVHNKSVGRTTHANTKNTDDMG